jgi:adenylate cyclase
VPVVDALRAPPAAAASATGRGPAGARVAGLCAEIAASVAQLRAQTTAAGATELHEDLARIADAADRLRALVAETERSAQPSPALDSQHAVPGPAAPAPTVGPLPPAKRATLLVVDDDAANRDVLARLLERLGHTVLQAANGRLALETLATHRVDVMLLDLMMPELDGFEVLARCRADAALRELPVIMISALDELASAARGIELGAEDYLPKPFDPVLLRARLGACLEKKRWRDQEKAYLATIERQAAELAEWNRSLEARVQQQLEEMERLGRLRRFLAPQLAEAILSSGDERILESHRREITVVFTDLRGFTAFAATAEPEDLMRVLREYHAAMGELIFHYEGTLERFAGDGLMVFFNDPLPCDDPTARAVRMAVAMRERVAELARGWRRLGHQLGFGVGIAHGYATLGKVGFEGRFDYAAIGTVTNLAARLCEEAEPGQILVSQRVYATVEELAEAEPLKDLSLKGFATPVPAFNITGLRETELLAPPAL